MNNLRSDFPILSRKINGHNLIYFDNAATTFKPQSVIEAISTHYSTHNGNPGRGIHTLAIEATDIIASTRKAFLQFIGAPDDFSVIFTRNTTASLNALVFHFAHNTTVGKPSAIITTQSEHHANFLPWLRLNKQYGIPLKIAPISIETGEINYDELEKLATENPGAILTITACSNVTGIMTDLEKVSEIADKYNLTVILDAAQLLGHNHLSMKNFHIDFLVGSAHKMYGPEGVGVLVGKKVQIAAMEPMEIGGGMIAKVAEDQYELKTDEERLEGGTPNTAGIAGFLAAIEYINEISWDQIEQREHDLYTYFTEQFQQLAHEYPQLKLLASTDQKRIPLFSFSCNLHPHDIADFLDSQGIAVRAGHHCAQPLHTALGTAYSTRASLSFYNTTDEIHYFFDILKQCLRKFS